MSSVTATVSTKGQLVIPAAMREELGIVAGGRISLTIYDGAIVLRPISDLLVEQTRGMLAGGASMADELQQQRRADRW